MSSEVVDSEVLRRPLRRRSLDEQARSRGITAVASADDLLCPGAFESDQEVDDFIAYTYAARRADLA